MHIAIESGRIEVVRFLLEAGADRNQVTVKGVTAVNIATQIGQPELIDLLMESGARR